MLSMILACVILLFKPFKCFNVSVSEDRSSLTVYLSDHPCRLWEDNRIYPGVDL